MQACSQYNATSDATIYLCDRELPVKDLRMLYWHHVVACIQVQHVWIYCEALGIFTVTDDDPVHKSTNTL